jgi:hypothetical protein
MHDGNDRPRLERRVGQALTRTSIATLAALNIWAVAV